MNHLRTDDATNQTKHNKKEHNKTQQKIPALVPEAGISGMDK